MGERKSWRPLCLASLSRASIAYFPLDSSVSLLVQPSLFSSPQKIHDTSWSRESSPTRRGREGRSLIFQMIIMIVRLASIQPLKFITNIKQNINKEYKDDRGRILLRPGIPFLLLFPRLATSYLPHTLGSSVLPRTMKQFDHDASTISIEHRTSW